MPETTPIYNFPYPCEGEAITVATFANLANAIDTKLLELQVDEFEALNRYSDAQATDSTVVAAGVDTVLAGATGTYTTPAAGVYMISASTLTTAPPATVTSHRVRVRKNAVVQFGTRQNPEAGTIFDIQTAGTLVCAAGDVISFQILYTGTGTWTVEVLWEIKMFVRIV